MLALRSWGLEHSIEQEIMCCKEENVQYGTHDLAALAEAECITATAIDFPEFIQILSVTDLSKFHSEFPISVMN